MTNYTEDIVHLGILASKLQELSRQLLGQACMLQAGLERLTKTSNTLQKALEQPTIDDHTEVASGVAPMDEWGFRATDCGGRSIDSKDLVMNSTSLNVIDYKVVDRAAVDSYYAEAAWIDSLLKARNRHE